ncbi:2Fe-2S iron-sulfur cluster binding domain protein [Paraburkholderia xenovorans LB400]|nr:2Fe-2S iron-sulfur cluster binding domain protein [Paraburkholderia xenovorans LB400]
MPAFSAGAHIDVHVSNGLVRQYSLCNDSRERSRYMICVLHDPETRGGSRAMHEMREGQTLEISEPRNHFPLASDSGHSVLLAGGIGVTPIVSMAFSLASEGASFEIHYCARGPSHAAFLDRFAEPDLRDRTRLYFDTSPACDRLRMQDVLATPSTEKHLYVCGPKGFIDAAVTTAMEAGWKTTNVHREHFSADPMPSGEAGSFTVRLAKNQRTVNVGPNERVIDALGKAGVFVPVSCEEGVCGTCLTGVLAGEPDHRDSYLTKRERTKNDRFLPCCSRSKTPLLVLDL